MNQTIRNLLLLFPSGGIKWLLRDEFSDTRAAGAVNGTPATPGPGTRVVTDTDSKLTVSGGNLTFAPHSTPAWGDPGLWHGAVTRTAGRVWVAKLKLAGANAHLTLGLDDNQAGAVNRPAFYFGTTGDILTYDTGGYFLTGSYQATTDYRIAIVLRSAGGYCLIKGGVFTTWTLLSIRSSGNTATLYPGVGNYSHTGTIDFVRIPDALWFPTPLAYDTYTRPNGAIGVSETAGPDGQAVTARTYTDQVGTWSVAGNTAVATVLGIVTLPALHADVVMQCTLTTPGAGVTPAGIVVRWLDANNYWYVRVTPGTAGNDFELVEINAGVPTVRGAADKDPAAATAYTITVITYGQTIDVYWNNVREINYTTAALNETQGIHGLRDEGNSNFIFDNLTVFPRGTGGEYAALDKWSS